MSSKLLLVALVLLFGYALSGVDAHVISKRQTLQSWARVPYEYMTTVYSEIEKKVQDIYEIPFVKEAWNHVTAALDKLNALLYQPPQH